MDALFVGVGALALVGLVAAGLRIHTKSSKPEAEVELPRGTSALDEEFVFAAASASLQAMAEDSGEVVFCGAMLSAFRRLVRAESGAFYVVADGGVLFRQADQGSPEVDTILRRNFASETPPGGGTDTGPELSTSATGLASVVEHGKTIFFHFETGNGDRFALTAVPLLSRDRVIGVVVLAREAAGDFDGRERVALARAGRLAAIHLEQVYRYTWMLEQRVQDTENRIASEFQSKLRPKKFPQTAHASVAGYTDSARGIYTDYIDAVSVKKDRIVLASGEVAGRAAGAALVAVIIRSLVHLLAPVYRNPDELLAWINRALSGRLDLDLFAALTILNFEPDRGCVSYASAGHQPFLHFAHGGAAAVTHGSTGQPLGIGRDETYGQMEIPVATGDIILLYSDGVVEAMNPQGQPYGAERLSTLVAEAHTLSAGDLAERIRTDIRKYRRTRVQHDDESVLVMKIL